LSNILAKNRVSSLLIGSPIYLSSLMLWQCAIGGSGSGKSAALAARRRLIDGLDDSDEDDDGPQRVVSEATLRALAGRRRGRPSRSSSIAMPRRPG
jgi:hypothetical protein